MLLLFLSSTIDSSAAFWARATWLMPIAGSLWLLLEMELLPSYALNGALTPNPAILSALKRIFCSRMRAVASRSRLVDSDPALTRFGSVE